MKLVLLFLYFIKYVIIVKTISSQYNAERSVHGSSTHYFSFYNLHPTTVKANVVSNFNVLLHIPPKQNLALPETYIVLLYFKSNPLYLINVNNKKRQNLQKLPTFKKQSLLYFCTITISKKQNQLPFYCFSFHEHMNKFKQKNENCNQLPFYRFLFFAQTDTNKRKSKNQLPFYRLLFFAQLLKQINEKAKINFRVVVFCFLRKLKQISEKQKVNFEFRFIISCFVFFFCAN